MSQIPIEFLAFLVVSAAGQSPSATSVPLRERSTLRCPVDNLPAISLPIPQGEVSLARSRVVTPVPAATSSDEELAKLLRRGVTARRLGELAKQAGADAVVDVQVGWVDNSGVRPLPSLIQYRVSGIPVKRRSPQCEPL